jgi:hypothetical protein
MRIRNSLQIITAADPFLKSPSAELPVQPKYYTLCFKSVQKEGLDIRKIGR